MNPSSWYQPHYYHFITCTLNNSPPISPLHLFSEGLPEYTRNKTCQEEIQGGNFICHPLQLTTRNCLPTSFLGLLQQQQVCSHAPQIIIWILSFALISSAPHPLQRNMSRDMLKKMFCHQPEHQPYPCRRYLSTQTLCGPATTQPWVFGRRNEWWAGYGRQKRNGGNRKTSVSLLFNMDLAGCCSNNH